MLSKMSRAARGTCPDFFYYFAVTGGNVGYALPKEQIIYANQEKNLRWLMPQYFVQPSGHALHVVAGDAPVQDGQVGMEQLPAIRIGQSGCRLKR